MRRSAGQFEHGSRPGPAGTARRGLILPVMLVILLLLALLVASFSFQMQADYSAAHVMDERFQCRQAAEAGLQMVMALLRTERDNLDAWYDNPGAFDQALVWKPGILPEEVGRVSAEAESERTYGYRFSIVADDPSAPDDLRDPAVRVRYGLTDESSRLNINVADEEQLTRLIGPALLGFNPEANPLELAQALIDWRDEDSEPLEFGAEDDYYLSLEVSHRTKNAPFETVEELLMVRGFTGQLLYGEDADRNGLLSANEDDGEISFPWDDGDGKLNRGLLPYITVYSEEFNIADDNKPRIYIFGDKGQITPQLEEALGDQRLVQFILEGAKDRGTEKIFSLADLLEPRVINNTLTESPFQGPAAHLLFDKCTMDREPSSLGRVNVNTAPAQVLRCILSEELVPKLIETRARMTGSAKVTPAWLCTEKVLTAQQYGSVAKLVTARARQFTAEVIGFADHTGAFVRTQTVLSMRGPLCQIVYNRDMTPLGLGYPIRGKEGERSFVRPTQ